MGRGVGDNAAAVFVERDAGDAGFALIEEGLNASRAASAAARSAAQRAFSSGASMPRRRTRVMVVKPGHR